jgi:hypothetical protein
MSQIDDINDRNLINLADVHSLDAPIFRIYPIDRFEKLLQTHRDALVSPCKWDDKFENFALAHTVVDMGNGEFASLEDEAAEWYAQCWSLYAETDGLWRAYCPSPTANLGVQVRSTICKVFANLKQFAMPAPRLRCFVGKVEYWTEDKIEHYMRKHTFEEIALGADGVEFARLLCVKRKAFAHEKEVRILYRDAPPSIRRGFACAQKDCSKSGVMELPIDPGIFEEVVVDPRLSELEAGAALCRLQKAGWKGAMRQSSLYAKPKFTLRVQ